MATIKICRHLTIQEYSQAHQDPLVGEFAMTFAPQGLQNLIQQVA